MTANFSDQGMTGSAKARRREVQAMRGPFSVALAGPKEGCSGLMSEIGGRRRGESEGKGRALSTYRVVDLRSQSGRISAKGLWWLRQ